MRFPSFFLETVAFVCTESAANGSNGPNIAGGTGFFVSVPEASWPYVVTARHCIEEIPASSIYLRIPTVGGASQCG